MINLNQSRSKLIIDQSPGAYWIRVQSPLIQRLIDSDPVVPYGALSRTSKAVEDGSRQAYTKSSEPSGLPSLPQAVAQTCSGPSPTVFRPPKAVQDRPTPSTWRAVSGPGPPDHCRRLRLRHRCRICRLQATDPAEPQTGAGGEARTSPQRKNRRFFAGNPRFLRRTAPQTIAADTSAPATPEIKISVEIC